MNDPLLSVIIPVYNAQETIRSALDSVLKQGINEIEIILVDDGSRDDSLAICRSYAQRDPRFKVISQKNAGPGAARNTALDVAGGRFIAFSDSDDTVPESSYARLLKAAGDADMVIARFNLVTGGKVINRGYIKDSQTLGKEAFLRELAVRPGSYYYSALWNKLYSGRLIKEHDIRFDTVMSWGEDFHFNMNYYRYVRKVSFLKEPVYNYIYHTSGQSWRTLYRVKRNILIKARLYHSLKELYRENGALQQYRHYINRYIFNVTLSK